MDNGFASLGLTSALYDNLEGLGYRNMTPIQAAALPPILQGEDVIAQAKTGSGKTAAFGLGILATLPEQRAGVFGLVLCPTRELAEQITVELRRLSRMLPNVRILPLCGGAAFGTQRASLDHGADVVVGTPGRILEHLEKQTLDLSALHVLVLDEADRMLDMGFEASIAAIVRAAPAKRQTLLFSATYSEPVRILSRGYQSKPREITVDTSEVGRDIDERFIEVKADASDAALLALLAKYQPESTLVFCNFKASCHRVVQTLQAAGVSAAELHGDMIQQDRDHTLLLFANKSCSVLVATDVAARGLDIKDLSLVVNYELSADPEVHHHRVGRTGRGQSKGKAVSLFSSPQIGRIRSIEEHTRAPARFEGLPPAVNGRLRLVAPMATVVIQAGRREKLRPSDVLGALTGPNGLPGDVVGKIVVRTVDTYVAVQRASVQGALARLTEGRIKGRSFKARMAPLNSYR